MSEIKLCLIGAGSGAFSLQMIRDICITPGLAGSTVVLMDINEKRLNAAHEVCRRLAAEKVTAASLLSIK